MQPLVIVTLASGDVHSAAVALGAFEGSLERFGVASPAPWEAFGGGPDPAQAMRDALGQERYDVAYEQGRHMDPDEALDFLEAAIAGITATALPSATEAVRPGPAG